MQVAVEEKDGADMQDIQKIKSREDRKGQTNGRPENGQTRR